MKINIMLCFSAQDRSIDMMQSIELLAETMNDVYSADGGYASNRPSSMAVPETIQQGYDADGGYQY
jgi:hypothetical protein